MDKRIRLTVTTTIDLEALSSSDSLLAIQYLRDGIKRAMNQGLQEELVKLRDAILSDDNKPAIDPVEWDRRWLQSIREGENDERRSLDSWVGRYQEQPGEISGGSVHSDEGGIRDENPEEPA